MFHREGHVDVDVATIETGQGGPAAASAAVTPPHEVSYAAIDPSYFAVLNTPILAGRAFNAGDVSPDSRVVIVDQAFVDQLLQGRNPSAGGCVSRK